MKMKEFKLITLLLAVTMVFVSACSSSNNKKTSETTEAAAGSDLPLYEVKIFANPDVVKVVKKSDETELGKIIKEKFNIVFELIPFSGDYKEKLNLMLAGGDYPEMMRVEDQDILSKYIDAGAVLPLDPYMENADNFKTLFKDAIPYWRYESGDGKIYNWSMGLPQDMIGFPEHNDISVRIDALKQQGYPNLLNTDDYVEFFKKAMADNPTTDGAKTIGLVAPFGEAWGIAGIGPIMYEKGGKYVQVANNATIWSPTEEKFVDMLKDEYTVESFKFFNKMYRAGVLDPDSFTDKMDQVQEKLNSGRALGVWYVSWNGTIASQELVKAGKPELQYIALPVRSPLQVERNEKRLKMTQATRPFDMAVITKNAKHPERLFDLINYFSSVEGQLLLQSGIEGVHYEIVDGVRLETADYKAKKLADPDFWAKQGFTAINTLPRALTAAPDGMPYALNNNPTVKDEVNFSQEIRDTYKALGWTDSEQYWRENSVEAVVGTAQSIFMDPATEEGRLEQRLIEIRVRNTPKLIMAKDDADFDRIYQDILKEYDKLNPQSIIDLYNQRYKEAIVKVEQFK